MEEESPPEPPRNERALWLLMSAYAVHACGSTVWCHLPIDIYDHVARHTPRDVFDLAFYLQDSHAYIAEQSSRLTVAYVKAVDELAFMSPKLVRNAVKLHHNKVVRTRTLAQIYKQLQLTRLFHRRWDIRTPLAQGFIKRVWLYT